MRTQQPPFWFRRLDRPKAAIGALLAVAALVLAVRINPPSQVVTPTIQTDAGVGLTAGTPIALKGTAAPGAKVLIYDNDEPLAETTAGPDGAWQFSVPALPAGNHSLVARTADAEGKPVTSQPLTFKLPEVKPPNVKAPELKLPAAADLQASSPFTLSGTAAPGAKVQVYDGETLLGETTAGPDGAWQFNVPALPAGDHSLTARTAGADGKPVTSQPFTFKLPEIALPEVKLPELRLPSLADLKAGSPFTLSGTAAPGAKVQVYDGETLLGETTAGPDGAWQFNVPALPAGDHSLTARTAGADGKPVTSQPFTFKLPEIALPEVKLPELRLPSLADLKAGSPFTLSGTAAPGAKVQVYDGETLLGETTAGPDGAWQFNVPALPAGDHSLTARTAGADGKPVTSQPFTFKLPEIALPEVKLPELRLPSLADLKAGSPFTLSGTAAPGAKVQVYDGETLLGETTAGPDGAWQFNVPALPAGDHSLTARTAGADGQPVASQPVTFTLPEAAPSLYPVPYVITLAPGETATLPVRGFCLNYGKPFPGAELQGADLGPDQVRAAIAYALKKGYVDSDPLQVQLAIWTLLDGNQVPGQRYTLANEIIAFARNAPVPEPNTAQTLADALAQALVTAYINNFASTSPANYQYAGAGSLALKNVSQQTLTLLVPYGMRFTDSSRAGSQDMGIFPTSSK